MEGEGKSRDVAEMKNRKIGGKMEASSELKQENRSSVKREAR